jgi:hypothetical protein
LKTIRTPSKPSTAKCNLDTYTLFLLAEPKYAGCNRLSEILGDVSHDSINRFLLRERYQPKDLFDEIKQHIDLIDGTLSGKVSVQPGVYNQVQELPIPDNGLVVHLKNFGRVKVFRKTFKNEVERYYIVLLPNSEEIEQLTYYDFKQLHSIHWGIECYHRAIKQLCGIERFMVRTTDALKTHFFCAIRAFTQLELMRAEDLIENWYELQRNLSLQIAREFILAHLKQRMGLNTY